MNYLVLTESLFPLNQPTAKCLINFISLNKTDIFFVVSKGNKKAITNSSNIFNIEIDSHYDKPSSFHKLLLWYLRKMFNRLFCFFWPRSLFGTKEYLRAANKLIRNNQIDRIIAVSGWFSTQKAGSILSKKHKINMISWYTDPFLFNINNDIFSINYLKRIETKWLKTTNLVIMPSNYYSVYQKQYPSFSKKFRISELPCLFSPKELTYINKQTNLDNIILHSGLIYPRINNFEWFCTLVKGLEDFSFITLEDYNKFFKKKVFPTNFRRMDRLSVDEYVMLYSKSSAILILDNLSGIQIPSKALEVLSTNKPVLFIYYSEESPTYKLFLNSENIFFIKENSLIDNDLLSRIRNYINKKSYCRVAPYTNDDEIRKFSEFIK